MTDSEKELVKRLRAWADPVESGYEIPAAGRSMREAADAIETLVKERDATNKLAVQALERAWTLVDERDEARAERDRALAHVVASDKSLEAAEAEVARLRETLEKVQVAANVLELMEPARHQLLGALQICWHASRSTLEAKHD